MATVVWVADRYDWVVASAALFYATLNRGVFGCLWCGCQPSADRIEINVHHAGRQRLFIQQGLRAVTTFPKPASDVVLSIGVAGDRFVEAAHEPANRHQPFAPRRRLFSQCALFSPIQCFAPTEAS